MVSINLKMSCTLMVFALFDMATVQSMSNGLSCHNTDRWNGRKSTTACHDGKCIGVWSTGNSGSYFCAKSLDKETLKRNPKVLDAFQQFAPFLNKLATGSRQVTVRSGFNFDGTTLQATGTVEPSTVLEIMTRQSFSFEFKSNDRIGDVKFKSNIYGTVNLQDFQNFQNLQMCLGKAPNCKTLDDKDEFGHEYWKELLENKKVTATIGNTITMETSFVGDLAAMLAKFEVNEKEIVDFESISTVKIGSSTLKLEYHGNTEKLPLSTIFTYWQETNGQQIDSSENELLKHFTDGAGTICIGRDCFNLGVCSENLCNSQQNLLEMSNSPKTVFKTMAEGSTANPLVKPNSATINTNGFTLMTFTLLIPIFNRMIFI